MTFSYLTGFIATYRRVSHVPIHPGHLGLGWRTKAAFLLRDWADRLDDRKSFAVYAIDSAGALTHEDVERALNASHVQVAKTLGNLATMALLDDCVQ